MPISADAKGKFGASLIFRSPVDSFTGSDRAAAEAARDAAITDTSPFSSNPNLAIILTYGGLTVYQVYRSTAWADAVGALRGAPGSDADATAAVAAAQAAATAAAEARDDAASALSQAETAGAAADRASNDAAQSNQRADDAQAAAEAAAAAAAVGRDSAAGSAVAAENSNVSAAEQNRLAGVARDEAVVAKNCAVDAQNAAANSATEAMCMRDETRDLRDEVKTLYVMAKNLVVGPIYEAVKAMINGGTMTGITITPQDADRTIDFEVTGGGGAVPQPASAPAVTIADVVSVNEDVPLMMRASVSGGVYDTISYAWSVVTGGGSFSGSGANVVYTPPDVSSDTSVEVRCAVTVRGTGNRAVDGTSDTASDTENFTVNMVVVLPVAAAPGVTITAVSDVDETETQDLSAIVDGGGLYDSLSYSWSVVSGGGSISGGGANVVYNPPDVGADTPVTVRCLVTARGTGSTARAGTSDTASDTEEFNVIYVPPLPIYLAQGADRVFTAADALAGQSSVGDSSTVMTAAATESQYIALFLPAARGRMGNVEEIDSIGQANPFGIFRGSFSPALNADDDSVDINGDNYYRYVTIARVNNAVLGGISYRITFT